MDTPGHNSTRENDTDLLIGAHPFVDLLAAARQGEGWAFNALHDWLSRPITAFISSKGLGDPGPVVNETFLGAFRGLDRFDGGATDFRRWVFGIARHKIIDARRSESRRPQNWVPMHDIDEQVIELGAGRNDVESEAIINLSTEKVQELFATLTDDQRDVLALRLVSDMTVPQIAIALDKPEGAVKALQRRALRRLASQLESKQVQL